MSQPVECLNLTNSPPVFTGALPMILSIGTRSIVSPQETAQSNGRNSNSIFAAAPVDKSWKNLNSGLRPQVSLLNQPIQSIVVYPMVLVKQWRRSGWASAPACLENPSDMTEATSSTVF